MRINIEGSELRGNVMVDNKWKKIVFIDATAGALTITSAMVRSGILVRDPNGAARSDTFPTAALLVAGFPNAAVRDTLEFTIINNADAAELITILAGTGMTFGAPQRTHTIAQNSQQSYWVQFTNVTLGAEAYVVYEK